MSGAVLKRPGDSSPGGDIKRAGISAGGDENANDEAQANDPPAPSVSVSTDSLPVEGHAAEIASETPGASSAPSQEPSSQTTSLATTGIQGSGGASSTESLQSASSSEKSGASQPPAMPSSAAGAQLSGSQGNMQHLMGYFQQQPPPAMGAGGLPGLSPAVPYQTAAAAAGHAVVPRPGGQRGSPGLSPAYQAPPPPTMYQPPYSFMSHPTEKAGGGAASSGDGNPSYSADGSPRYFPYGGQYEQYGLSMGPGLGHNPYAPQQQQQPQQHLGTLSRLHPSLHSGMSGSTHPAFGHPSLSALAAHHNPFGLLHHSPGAALMANMVGGPGGVQLGQLHPAVLHSAMSGYGAGVIGGSGSGGGMPAYEPPRVRGPTCMSCARSKVKCDRTTPCARCVRLRLECVPRTKVRGQAGNKTAATPPRVAALGNDSSTSNSSGGGDGSSGNNDAALSTTASSSTSDGSAMPPPLSASGTSKPPVYPAGNSDSSGSGTSNHHYFHRSGAPSLAPLHVAGAPFGGSSFGVGAMRGPNLNLSTPPAQASGNGTSFDFGSPANANNNAPAGGSFDSVSTLGFGASSLSSQDLLYFDYQAAAYAQHQQHQQYEQQQRQPQAAERAYYQFQRDQEQAEFKSRQLRQNSEPEERPPSIEEEGAEDKSANTARITQAEL